MRRTTTKVTTDARELIEGLSESYQAMFHTPKRRHEVGVRDHKHNLTVSSAVGILVRIRHPAALDLVGPVTVSLPGIQ